MIALLLLCSIACASLLFFDPLLNLKVFAAILVAQSLPIPPLTLGTQSDATPKLYLYRVVSNGLRLAPEYRAETIWAMVSLYESN